MAPTTTSRDEAEVRSAKSARIAAIFDWIERDAKRVDASATEAAASLGISDRYVRQVLEETGHTFSEHMLEQRVMLAFKLLSDPRLAARMVADLALEAGFNDVAYFYRAFRTRFGNTPTRVRDGGGPA